MTDFLHIQARLPREEALELSARLLALRPTWDPEIEADGLCLFIAIEPGQIDRELTAVEEACRMVERHRPEPQLELSVTKVTEKPQPGLPPALGPWTLTRPEETATCPPRKENQLVWPPFSRPSRRLWATAELATILMLEHLTPHPGAPDTKNKPALTLEEGAPALCLAACLAGATEVTLAADKTSCATAQALFLANSRPAEIQTHPLPFKTLTRQKTHWANRFGLIVVHLSPYLASRRLKVLAPWLEPAGTLIVTGFTPGIQTAHLLRAAARAGLVLSTSIISGDWGAMRLGLAPLYPELPPLTGSVVPDLEDLPEVEDIWTAPLEGDPDHPEAILADPECLLPDEDDDEDGEE